ncbi:unnamed protein product [Leptidea sinapis]|uniref:Uncharacterized protein n=1 Tax=Leptidea sinapis TaxID=189913 RepID=A0A5E4PT63_9NEOP|nr:unnamed protein product [Leptidea sinapis]
MSAITPSVRLKYQLPEDLPEVGVKAVLQLVEICLAPMGPFHGTSDKARAVLAALIATVSGRFVPSTASILHTICVSKLYYIKPYPLEKGIQTADPTQLLLDNLDASVYNVTQSDQSEDRIELNFLLASVVWQCLPPYYVVNVRHFKTADKL